MNASFLTSFSPFLAREQVLVAAQLKGSQP